MPKYEVECPVCNAVHSMETVKDRNRLQRKIWAKIRLIFNEAYNNLFIYGSKKLDD